VSHRTVAFATLGCRLNQTDTQDMQGLLEARGFRTVPFGEPADVVVVNSCAVTARAESSDRSMIRRATRLPRRPRVVVTGCWAQTDPSAVEAIDGVDLVLGTAEKPRIAEFLEGLWAAGAPGGHAPRRHVSEVDGLRGVPEAPLARAPGRSRAFVKVQDGCQHRCAFCIVPLARGGSRSRPPGPVLDRVRALVAAGHPEVVLTGVDLGHYGADLVPRTTLAALLRRLVEVPGLRWVRLSSLLPAYFTPELVELVTSSAIVAPHLHIPLQSGSDRVLRRMRRPYNVALYRALVERLVVARPGLGLGADVMVGFPGETGEDFADTVALVRELPLSYLHVFGYSDRRATEAAALGDRVDRASIERRSRTLRSLAREKSAGFRAGLLGRVEEVLVLESRDRSTGGLVGLTGHYVEVTFDGPAHLERRLTRVRITDAGPTWTRGRLAGLGEGSAT
jgi:threonylcarbamoyladenosine tRNA methylthiotransferase MtaB